MKNFLAPSILSFDFSNLGAAVETMSNAGATIIHFDVMDGQFVPPITFGDHMVASLRSRSTALFEVHLMTMTPEAQFEAFVGAGAQRIIFHVEATMHAHRVAQELRRLGVQAGVAINPGTSVETVLPLLDVVDEVLVMTVNPGWGGQKFIHRTLDKVQNLRRAKPDLQIEVDGGIDPDTLPLAIEAGANIFVVGSYLAKSEDLESATKALVAQCD